MGIFVEVVLPVLAVFLAGFVIQKRARLDIRSVSTVGMYIMLPCLVFETFYNAELNRDYIMMLVFSLLLLFIILIMNKIYAWMKGYGASTESALILSTAFMNSGNYGSPIILFAFGEQGFIYAISLMVMQAIIMNFFGVYYAAKGTAGLKMAFLSVLKMPPTYAVLIAMIMKFTGMSIGGNVMGTIELVAAATVPTIMVVLGMQLAEISVKSLEWTKISYAATVRLVASPLIAFMLVLLLPMSNLMASVLVVQAAMPSAATTTIYAVQFDSRPELVSGITLVTTLFSIVTIPLLLMVYI
ncbi:AEC family transporter [Salimicrobium flavidum]|uniref:AEC family transporter n=1 Tax=Salimicrobium flavidum TaxID=570947 RepID=A0A1N7IRE3_9BACI|nr:AEC family transporter [Salimicrobium flavidum]SIS39665.1 hypothetical protein SAMN05421687_10229 [Salimicrobium flavidum]